MGKLVGQHRLQWRGGSVYVDQLVTATVEPAATGAVASGPSWIDTR